jgi:hypothetical protein
LFVCLLQTIDAVLRNAEMNAQHPDIPADGSVPAPVPAVDEFRVNDESDEVAGGPTGPRQARAAALAAAEAAPSAPKSAAEHRRAARLHAVRHLVKMHVHLSNAIACMLATDAGDCPEECPEGQEAMGHLIDVYEREIRLFVEALLEWTPRKTGMIMSMSGARLFNWPLHCMAEHLATQMRFLLTECNMLLGVVTTQVRSS